MDWISSIYTSDTFSSFSPTVLIDPQSLHKVTAQDRCGGISAYIFVWTLHNRNSVLIQMNTAK
jgi:hypothetical protein